MNLIKHVSSMALFCHIVLYFMMPLQAKASLNDLDSKIFLLKDKIGIIELIEELEKQSQVHFIYDIEQIKSVQIKKIQFRNLPLGNVLTDLERSSALEFKIINKSSIAVSVNKQKVTSIERKLTQKAAVLKGLVLNERNQPLAGATLKIVELDKTIQSDEKGFYQFSLNPSKYTLEIRYLSYQTRRIAGMELTSGQHKVFDIILKEAKKGLETIEVTANIRRASVEGHYLRQKNESVISNGLSAEQMSVLPDKSVGESLKRISGVSTNDNRRVVVRGIAERYNTATLDGSILPSTDVQVRDFEFDIIPTNLVDNVIVYKTASPDMSFGFGGGLIQINTMAVPEKDFLTFTYGNKYVNGSTGKDFLGYARGKSDYLGFDDGSRDHFPKELLIFNNYNYRPNSPWTVSNVEGVVPITPDDIAAQNKRIGGLERIGTRVYKTLPGQNFQLSLGKNYNFNAHRFGFIGSVSYRNEQQIDDISYFGRGEWEKLYNNRYILETGELEGNTTSNQYNFTSNVSGLLNLGYVHKNHKVSVRNFYSRVFNNQFSRIEGVGMDIGTPENPAIREYDRPKFINLLQHRINGEHQFGPIKWDWNVSLNTLNNKEQDAVEAWVVKTKTINGSTYNILPSGLTNPGMGTFNRGLYDYKETNRIAETALSYGFNVKEHSQLVKIGYQFLKRVGEYDWMVLPIGTNSQTSKFGFVPVYDWNSYLEFKDPFTDLMYYPAAYSNNGYKGQNVNQAYYAMMENKISDWFTLSWGLRSEYYKYDRIEDGTNDLRIIDAINRGEKKSFVDSKTGRLVSANITPETQEITWRHLPSASLTLRPFLNFNLRAGYGQSVVRPALIENSKFIRFDPMVGVLRVNEGVLSTIIDHYDFRVEWYPKAGEVISIGYFHKYFDQPVEQYRSVRDNTGQIYLETKNSDWAKVRGWEFDVRKNLGFIASSIDPLNDLYVTGNLTIQESSVQSSYYLETSFGADKYKNTYVGREKVYLNEKRPLYGQVPLLYNIGLQYDGDRFGANVAWNYSGYKTFAAGMEPQVVEYERPRSQLDAQLSYVFLRDKKLKTKLNMSNLLNSASQFYINSVETYKLQDRWKNATAHQIWTQTQEWGEIYEWKYGFSKKYEEGYYEQSEDGKSKIRVGDKDTFIRKVGTSFSLSISYSF